jgi:ABC-type nitrate/sulfonate/bicarbonate transport system permease component
VARVSTVALVSRAGTRWALTLALVLVWEALGATLVRDPRTAQFFPLPSAVARAGWSLLADGTLAAAAAHSTARVAIGTALAVVLGVPLGAWIALAPRAGVALAAPLRLIRPIPPVAWVPLTLLWFGVTELQQVVVLALAAFLVVVEGTRHAVAGVPGALFEAARNLGARQADVALRVAVPAALPAVAATVREAAGTAWFVLVAAELLAAAQGLGVLVVEGRDLLEPPRMCVGMLALGAGAAITDTLLAALAHRLGRGT